jgi:steroid 5-alpha reductase family enzyme
MVVDAWLVTAFAVFYYVTRIWVASLILRDSSIVDIFWGLGFVVVAWRVSEVAPGPLGPRAWLLTGLVAV